MSAETPKCLHIRKKLVCAEGSGRSYFELYECRACHRQIRKPLPKKLKANAGVLGALKRALAAARLERCAVPAEHQEAMHIYLNTWVVGPLKAAIREMTGDDEA